MARPVTLFTGQWADLKIADLARRPKSLATTGFELPCWGDHFEVDKALKEPGYCAAKRDLLAKHDLQCWASAITGRSSGPRQNRRTSSSDSLASDLGRW